FCYAAGAEQMMNAFKRHTHHQRIRGMSNARQLLQKI
ncbi:transposase, partial [Paraglaciecola chathamensis]|nr:transposase [Paraglaciecola chathamensis]